MASAGPEVQAKLLKSLGLTGFIMTDGKKKMILIFINNIYYQVTIQSICSTQLQAYQEINNENDATNLIFNIYFKF